MLRGCVDILIGIISPAVACAAAIAAIVGGLGSPGTYEPADDCKRDDFFPVDVRDDDDGAVIFGGGDDFVVVVVLDNDDGGGDNAGLVFCVAPLVALRLVL